MQGHPKAVALALGPQKVDAGAVDQPAAVNLVVEIVVNAEQDQRVFHPSLVRKPSRHQRPWAVVSSTRRISGLVTA